MTTESIFFIQLVERNVISFKLIGRDDLKFRFMPSALLNYIAQGHMPFDLTRTIRYRIRNFEGSPWEEKIRERGGYYREIQDKVHEQLEVWEKEGKVRDFAKTRGDGVKGIRKSVTFEDMQSAKSDNEYPRARNECAGDGQMSNNTGKAAIVITSATVAALLRHYFHMGFESSFGETAYSVLSLVPHHMTWTSLVMNALLPMALLLGMGAMSHRKRRESHRTSPPTKIETCNDNIPSQPPKPQPSQSEIMRPSEIVSTPQSSLKPSALLPADENTNTNTKITANVQRSPSTASTSRNPSASAPQAPKSSSPRIPPMKKVGSLLSSAPKGMKKVMPSAKSFRTLRTTSGNKN